MQNMPNICILCRKSVYFDLHKINEQLNREDRT